jgi:hypothetical protein
LYTNLLTDFRASVKNFKVIFNHTRCLSMHELCLVVNMKVARSVARQLLLFSMVCILRSFWCNFLYCVSLRSTFSVQ